MSISVSGNYYGGGAGVDSYKTTSKFIPDIWSGKLQLKFYKATVLGDITNNDWEGEIKSQGDKITIRTIPTITINSYSKGQTLTSQVPTSTPIDLSIDKGKYFQVVLDDVDKVQADVNLMDQFTNDAAEQMKISIDNDVLDGVKSGAAAANLGATAGAISANLNLGTDAAPRSCSKATVLDFILDMGQALDEQNVPETGRWMVVPAWMAAIVKGSDLKQAYLTGDSTSILRNGKIGMIDRFTMYVSNNLPRTADFDSYILAGTRDAISFASQMTQVETIRSNTSFGNILRGLNVYGYQVIKPEALVRGIVVKA
ncbi:hypothetical protein UFOVP1304_39 [uncultured Caudovirales phage]|uniref:Major capsid protein Gp5 n=1 Tax=uncultured Caudovirales phage TaxID=2100421 RepID=A0A6J5RY73_9CAUD|nr:hypothetical protein UFOVP1304_39 [uncultured Caudovirales phage]